MRKPSERAKRAAKAKRAPDRAATGGSKPTAEPAGRAATRKRSLLDMAPTRRAAATDRQKVLSGLAEERNIWRLMGLNLSKLRAKASRGAADNKTLLDEVKTLCLFIGYPRSGHSLVGSLLDAHPQMAIAHELDALYYLKHGFRPREILYLMLELSRLHGEIGRRWGEYIYDVPGQWQGRHAQLQVIGDKKGGMTTLRIARQPQLLENVMTRFGKRKRFVHVLRNPFDNIAAMVQKGQPLNGAIAEYFDLVQANRMIIKALGPNAVATLHHEDIVADPKAELGRLCRFLGVVPSPDYLDACASIVFPAPRQPRHKIAWPADTVRALERRIAAKPMLDRYRFKN